MGPRQLWPGFRHANADSIGDVPWRLAVRCHGQKASRPRDRGGTPVRRSALCIAGGVEVVEVVCNRGPVHSVARAGQHWNMGIGLVREH